MTTDTSVDPYGLSSGLIDDFDGTITEAYFGTDAAYNNGDTVLLILELSTDNPDTPSTTEKLSCGTGWVIENGGGKISKETGKPQFNKNSRVGMVLAAAVQSGAGEVMRAKGSPMEAATWQGLGFHWERVSVTGFNGEAKDVLLPTGFLGGANGAAAAKPEGVSPGMRAKLTVAAKNNDDFTSFVNAALEIEGVAESAEACALATSEEFYNSARG